MVLLEDLDAIALVNDAATELVLTTCCADACKVNHLLRTDAPEVSCEQLEAYDGLMRGSLKRILGGPLDDLAFAQAATGVRDSGLGFRLASAGALPAYVASRVESRPAVLGLVSAFAAEGLLPDMAHAVFDADIASAGRSMLAGLSAEGQAHATQLIENACQNAEIEYAVMTGRLIAPAARSVLSTSENAELLAQAAGNEDPEHQHKHLGLQQSLMRLCDAESLDKLIERLVQAER